MRTQHTASTNGGQRHGTKDEGRAAGLMALVIFLIVVVCGSASVLLTVPQAFEAVASAGAPTEELSGASEGERTFHERYPIKAVEDAVDSPTF